MANIQVPASFFQQAKREYRTWRTVWVREALQNSIDAGATRIDLETYSESDKVVLSCTDNGSGMTLDTIENVFLCLGASLKPAGSTGGFGYAKTLLLLAHSKYVIHSGSSLIQGSGGSYSVHPAPSHLSGTMIKVWLDQEGYSAESWGVLIRQYVSLMYVNYYLDNPVSIYLNGDEVSQDQVIYDDAYTKEGVGTLYSSEVPENLDQTKVLVCVRGLPMFIETLYNPGNPNLLATFDIEEYAESVDVFTSNRDGFTSKSLDQFQAFIFGIIRSPRTANQSADLALWFNGKRHLQVTQASNTEEVVAKINDDAVSLYGRLIPHMAEYPKNMQLRVSGFSSRRHRGDDPYVTSSSLVKLMSLARTRRLAEQWLAICNIVLSTAYFSNLGVVASGTEDDVTCMYGDTPIYFGYVMAAKIEGLCTKSSDAINILINPMTVTSDTWIGDLLDTAIHECAHIVEGNHGERFTQVEAEIRKSLRHEGWTERDVERSL